MADGNLRSHPARHNWIVGSPPHRWKNIHCLSNLCKESLNVNSINGVRIRFQVLGFQGISTAHMLHLPLTGDELYSCSKKMLACGTEVLARLLEVKS